MIFSAAAASAAGNSSALFTYNGYQWDEVMSAMSDMFLCGGDCVEDVNRSECHLRESPEVRIPTSHTIGRAITACT